MYWYLCLLFVIDTISLRDLLLPFFLQYNMESFFSYLGCTGLSPDLSCHCQLN